VKVRPIVAVTVTVTVLHLKPLGLTRPKTILSLRSKHLSKLTRMETTQSFAISRTKKYICHEHRTICQATHFRMCGISVVVALDKDAAP
jgi:hypothetical protein